MRTIFILSIYCFVGSISWAQINPSFSPIPSSFGILSPNPVIATDVVYDTKDSTMQAFHLLLPDTTGSYPLVVYIHGGGFLAGSRNLIYTSADVQLSAKYFLEQGIAFACIGYRLLPTSGPIDTIGVKKCMGDSKKALQFMRYYAQDLHLNPQKFAVSGGSAGAGTSLWLASRDNMADPNASNPVDQMSTRVCAAFIRGSQSTYDLYRWETEIYHNFDGQGNHYTLDSMQALLGFDRYANFYGGVDSTYHILYDSALMQYRQDVDMLYHLSSDDPPLYIFSNSQAVHPSDDVMHHPFHSRAIYNTAINANIQEVKGDIAALNINNTFNETGNEFLARQLNNCSISTNINEVHSQKNVLVFPNPVVNLLNIKLNEQLISRITLFNAAGQIIQATENIQAHDFQLSTSNLPKGMYCLQISTQNGERHTQLLTVLK